MFKNDWQYSINAKTFDGLDSSLFRNFKFGTVVNYIFLAWGLTILKFLLFVSDVYTCIKLLAFNSWSNNIIQPYLPFRISKWLFSGCILASIVLLIWETICGIRIYRTRNISLTYVNNFSRTLYSLSNYSIFCVFDKITPKGAYQRISFFTFFELKNCVRLLFTDTPRQVINGLTLWSVLVTVSDDSNLGDLESFDGLIAKIKSIANTNHEEAVLLSFMLFSFIIWAFFISKLAIAMLFSVYVYYKLIKQHKYNSLKEFVCVTISHNVDGLVEKQKRKKNPGNGPYETGPGFASTASFFQIEDLENKGGLDASNKGAKSAYPNHYNDSTVALLGTQYQNNNFSRISPENTDTKDQEKKIEDDIDVLEEPLGVTSAINDTFQKENESNVFRGTTWKEPRYKYVAKAIDAFDSNETLPSYHLKETPSNNLSNRPRPPPLINTQNTKQRQERINTPTRAYTRALDSDVNSNQFPQRTTSLMNRRERIANEDYEHYVQRHRR